MYMGACHSGHKEGDIMSRGGLLRTEYVIGIPLDNFINSISLYKFILILQKRKLRIRRLKGYTRSCSSEGVGCDWHPVCLTANLVLILLHHSHCLPVFQPRGRDCWDRGTRPLQGTSLWNECEKGGWGAGDPACHCSHNPLNPSCLRVPGLTPETPFGLPVFPAGGSQAYILSHQPPPPPRPGPHAPASCRVMAV